jgi:hypothetical protein
MKTPYDVLGISPDADEKTIAIAFREAAKRCHPDLNPGDHAAERFKQLSTARDALSNPAWRALYQYVQLKRRHDRRQWIVTIASCIVSAVVSAGLVNFLQKPSIADPQMGAAAVSAEARRENDEPTQSVAIPNFQQAGNETANTGQESGRLEFPVFNMAQRVPKQELATLQEDVQERERAPPASKQQPVNSCCERLENRSERVLKVRGRSVHYGATAGQSSGRNHNRRKPVRKQMHAAH